MPKKTPEQAPPNSLSAMSMETLLTALVDQLKLSQQTQANIQVLEREIATRKESSSGIKTNGVLKTQDVAA